MFSSQIVWQSIKQGNSFFTDEGMPTVIYLGTVNKPEDIQKKVAFLEKHVKCFLYHIVDVKQLLYCVSNLSHINFIGIDSEAIYGTYDIIELVRTLRFIMSIRNINSVGIGVAIDHTTPRHIVQSLIRAPHVDCIPFRYTDPRDWGKLIDQTKRFLQKDYTMPAETKSVIDQIKSCRKPKPPNESLTPRQTQILNLIQHRGLSNKQIAKTMDISESAVKAHVTSLLKHFNVKSRSQLISLVPKST